jgi:hypothetical protein
MHSFWRLLVHASHELQQETFLDNFVAIDGGSDARDQTIIDMITIDHCLELIELGLGESFEEGVTAVFSDVFFAPDICCSTLKMLRYC